MEKPGNNLLLISMVPILIRASPTARSQQITVLPSAAIVLSSLDEGPCRSLEDVDEALPRAKLAVFGVNASEVLAHGLQLLFFSGTENATTWRRDGPFSVPNDRLKQEM